MKGDEARYKNIFDSINDIIYILDTEGKVTSVNKAVKNLLGLEPEEIFGRHFTDWVPKEGLPRAREVFKQSLNGERIITETAFFDKDGKLRHIESSSGPIMKDRKVVGIRGVVRDITARKKAEEKLRELEGTFARIIEGAPIGIQMINGDFVITRWNRGMEKIFEIKRRNVEGKSIFELFPVFMEKTGGAILNKVLKTGKSIEINGFRHYSNRRKKELVLNLRYAPVKGLDNHTIGIVAMIEDVTAREELQREAQQDDRLVIVGQLAAGIAHEINNPLTAAMGNIELVLEELKENKERCEGLELAQEAVVRCSEVAKRLLKLTEQTKLSITEVELNQVIQDSLKLIKAEATLKDITIQTELSPRIRYVHADRQQLQQVFVNLFINSIHAMGEEGILKVKTRNSDSGRSVMITISDTGCGIKKEDFKKLFMPFFTTKPSGEGSGLGLSIAKQVIDRHKGNISIKSKSGKGTAITIKLPVKCRKKRRQM